MHNSVAARPSFDFFSPKLHVEPLNLLSAGRETLKQSYAKTGCKSFHLSLRKEEIKEKMN